MFATDVFKLVVNVDAELYVFTPSIYRIAVEVLLIFFIVDKSSCKQLMLTIDNRFGYAADESIAFACDDKIDKLRKIKLLFVCEIYPDIAPAAPDIFHV